MHERIAWSMYLTLVRQRRGKSAATILGIGVLAIPSTTAAERNDAEHIIRWLKRLPETVTRLRFQKIRRSNSCIRWWGGDKWG